MKPNAGVPQNVRLSEVLGLTAPREVLQAALTRWVARFTSAGLVLGLLDDEIADVRTCDSNRTGHAEAVAYH